ncbi:hypothetical protein EG328_004832 [Venturia inaequalis]|nr:hypothetical protein EG328_004832 [Venturia inaequalis]
MATALPVNEEQRMPCGINMNYGYCSGGHTDGHGGNIIETEVVTEPVIKTVPVERDVKEEKMPCSIRLNYGYCGLGSTGTEGTSVVETVPVAETAV